jgi:hypothetical protein
MGVRLVHNDNVPPDDARVIAVVDAVTTSPPASSTVITGWVKNAVPERPATGWVLKINCDAKPVMLKLWLVADVKPLLEALIVRAVPYALP